MTVYGRFFKLYLYTAIAPVPLSTFAGEPTQNVGKKMCIRDRPVALTRFLEDRPHVKTVYLHLDNDTAGRLAAKAIMAVMPEGYRVENKPPPRGKDVNDFLCHRLGIPIRGSQGKEYER